MNDLRPQLLSAALLALFALEACDEGGSGDQATLGGAAIGGDVSGGARRGGTTAGGALSGGAHAGSQASQVDLGPSDLTDMGGGEHPPLTTDMFPAGGEPLAGVEPWVGGAQPDEPDMGDEPPAERDMGAERDMAPPPPTATAFKDAYWSATHNSYEGGERGSVLEQLNSGVRALEYDIHDNDFQYEGYRLGHFQFGDAVARGGENPSTDRLGEWLEVIQGWSERNPGHAPIILTIDLKDNLMDNRSYAEGNLAHLNDVLSDHLEQLWAPSEGLEDVDAARGHTLCVLSGDGGTRRGYLHDVGSSPALAVSSSGRLLELHDSGSGALWYWGGLVSSGGVSWRRHGQYDTGQRPAALIAPGGQVIEVHQSESRTRLWASTGSISSAGELALEPADDFSDGTWPSLQWREPSAGTFTLRYLRGGSVYERDGSANFSEERLTWGAERPAPEGALIFSRKEVIHIGKSYRVSTEDAPAEYPVNTLWLSVTNGGVSRGSPIRYEQRCFVEWQRGEHSDPLLGQQAFGALPGGGYASLPSSVRSSYVIRGWEFSGRDPSSVIPQMPSTDYPYQASYQALMEALGALE